VRRWTDEDGLNRYTVEPIEISLVDLPCLPQARFEMIKADGSREWREFGKRLDPIARLSTLIDNLEELQSDAGLDAPGETQGFDQAAQLRALLGDAIGVLRKLLHREALNSTGDEDDAPVESAHAATRPTHTAMPAIPLSPVAAQNDAKDLSRIQTTHDTSAKLGTTSDVQKRADAALEKKFHAITAKLDDLLQRVKNIESQPLPLPLSGRVRTVSKAEDGAPEVEKHMEPASEDRDALALLAIKKAQRSGRDYFGRW
jgi:hypothetical protein